MNWRAFWRAPPQSGLNIELALEHRFASIERRWQLAGADSLPRDEWQSFDRTPWKHPWLTSPNISIFSKYSRIVLNYLEWRISRFNIENDNYAFAGNMANVNYTRSMPLRRRGINVDLILHPSDTYVMSHPGWEEFDGALTELGGDLSVSSHQLSLPEGAYVHPLDNEWVAQAKNGAADFMDPSHILRWPEFMPYLPTLRALSEYDALLVSQAFYLGLLSGRPYILAQMGGDIWFDASRDDALGKITRLALKNAYAVLVSNPLTLSHARRYGLTNLIYLPWALDEERYRPGDASKLRAEWQAASGGDYFVLCSMRMDRQWKGAQHAIEGFSKFAAQNPRARLVLLSWGSDLEAARQQLAAYGISDRVLFLPTVGKKRLISYLQASDVLIEQFVLGYYGGSALEAIACGTPVIMRLERAQYDALIDVGGPPTLDAENGDDVAAQLQALSADPEYARDLRHRSREWFLAAQSSRRWHRATQVLLAGAARGIKLPTWLSPLNLPIGKKEHFYNHSQLAKAPIFPNYTDS